MDYKLEYNAIALPLLENLLEHQQDKLAELIPLYIENLMHTEDCLKNTANMSKAQSNCFQNDPCSEYYRTNGNWRQKVGF